MATPWGTDLNPIKKIRIIGGRQVEITSAKSRKCQLPVQPAHAVNRTSALPPIARQVPSQNRDPDRLPQKASDFLQNTSDKLDNQVQLSELEAAFVHQAQKTGGETCTSVARQIQRLPRDHYDCVEHDDILGLFRRSRIVLDAPEFQGLLHSLDIHANSTVPFDAIPRLLNIAASIPKHQQQIHLSSRGDYTKDVSLQHPVALGSTAPSGESDARPTGLRKHDSVVSTQQISSPYSSTAGLSPGRTSSHVTESRYSPHGKSAHFTSNSTSTDLLTRIAQLQANRLEFEREFRSKLFQPQSRLDLPPIEVPGHNVMGEARLPVLPTTLPRIQANRHY